MKTYTIMNAEGSRTWIYDTNSRAQVQTAATLSKGAKNTEVMILSGYTVIFYKPVGSGPEVNVYGL